MDDCELLREYRENRSDQAFANLVERYLPLVYSVALRVLGEPQAAEDVAQAVFIQLAQKAPSIREGHALAGWLYRATQHDALNALRSEKRRRQRETEAMNLAEESSRPEVVPEQLAPLLEQAIGQLRRVEQDAVVLRFFQGKSFRETGQVLAMSEEAARKRVDRALDKMRAYFARCGITASAALLTSTLSAHAAGSPVPAGLAAKVAGVSVANAASGTFAGSLLNALYMATNTKIILTAALLGAAFAVGWSGFDFVPAQGLPSVKRVVVKNVPRSPADALAQARADLAKLLRTPGSRNRERMIMDYVEKLNASDTQALLAEFATEPLTESARELLPYLAYRRAEMDPDSAWAWLQTVPNKEVQTLCADAIFDAYSLKNAPAAFSALTKLAANYNFIQLAVTVINSYALQDPRAALAALQNASADPKFAALLPGVSIFDDWTQQDPAAAAAAQADLPVGPQQRSALRMIAQTWAKQDPAAALAWANTLPDAQSQAVAMNLILNTYSVEDPAAAANYVLANSSSNPGPALITIVQNWAKADPSALLTWANQNLTGQPYNRAAIQALQQLGNSDPAAAAAYLAQNPDPNVVTQAVPTLAAAWGQQNPQAALAWAQSLSADNVSLRSSAIGQAISGWGATNPAAAAAYLQQNFATNPDFGNMTSHLATVWGATNPQAALQWAKSLPPDVQTRVTVAAMQQLGKADPAAGSKAAQEALGSLSNLTQSQQTALQKIIDATASH